MSVQTPQELLKHELGDLLYAEKQILKAMKPMIREASDPEMRERLQEHERETEEQIRNIEQAFEAMGERARAQKCPGILGIIEEKKDFEDEDPTPEIREAFNLGAGLRVEHYEIAGYNSAITLATATGLTSVADLLHRNLEQEIAMARFIEQSAPRALQMVEQRSMERQAEEMEKGASRSASGRKGSTTRKSSGSRKSSTRKSSTRKSSTRNGSSNPKSSSRSSGRKSSSSSRASGSGRKSSSGRKTSSGRRSSSSSRKRTTSR